MREREAASVGRRSIALLLAALVLAPGSVGAQEGTPDPPAVVDAFEVAGDAAGADDAYAWQITQPGRQWTLALEGPDGESLSLELLRADRSPVDRVRGIGTAALYDLALAPGPYLVVVARSPRDVLPYALAASRQDRSFDPEPNDETDTAASLEEGGAVTGRLARSDGDRDLFVIEVPAGSDRLRDVTLEWSASVPRTLCLLDDDGLDIACRFGDQGLGLFDLGLDPGRHVLSVRGSVDLDADYVLRVEDAGERRPDHETEPNDMPAMADDLDPALGISGTSGRDDPDHFRMTVEGDPQLWRMEARGPALEHLAWMRADGTELGRARPDGDGTAILEDLYLIPGTHLFRVRASEGAYRLEATPLGAPDPDGEREPNDEVVRAETYRIGQRRVGRLATAEDVDNVRFTVAAPEHLRLRLTQPPDADLRLQLRTGETEILRRWAVEPGRELELDLWLEPGDYLLTLWARQPSDGTYELTTERLDPFVAAADQEPNDSPAFARPVPATLRWSGDAGAGNDERDWFVLPPLAESGEVVLRMEAERPRLRLYSAADARTAVELRQEEDGSFRAADVAADLPLYLEADADGPYALSAESSGWAPVPEPGPLPVDLAVALETDAVAAYWPEAQRVDGTLTLSSASDESLELTIATRTSHYAWRAVPAEERISLDAGATAEVPLSVEVGPDAWADEPVRISLAARAPDGGLRTTAAVVDAWPRAPAVGTSTGWTVPEALVGGLNVASLALGAVPGGDDVERESALYDGVTPAGGGFGRRLEALPAEFVVDLAGEAPLPIAGAIINPLARAGILRETPRHIELLLSTDGETWATALTGELTPLPIDQAFVLPEPMPATHAMLRVHSMQDGQGSFLSLGEWKVIAVPGAVPDTMPGNIADPVRGGHVVRRTPMAHGFDFQTEMLDGQPKRQVGRIGKHDERFEVVIGFQDGRAAQVTELRWQDPEGSDEAARLDRLDVHIGMAGPLGPWETVGAWQLERAADGSVPALTFAEPLWVRYVRLVSPFPEGAREVELPARIEVQERPPDDDYRSILGEWGYTSSLGPFEWLVPPRSLEVTSGPDAADTREDATPLALDVTVADRVEIGEDVDWYRVDVPAGHNTLQVDVTGVPTVGVRLSLSDGSGQPIPMAPSSQPDGSVRHEAVVEPGSSYGLMVEQPPFSVVFTFDTSGSMGPFLDFVMEGVREFASDVEPGREAVMIAPFEDAPLLADWQDQPFVLMDAVNGYVDFSSSSAAETGLLASTGLLAGREGTRAILIVTDAETSSVDRTPELWAALEGVRPIIHTVHVGASNQPWETRRLMQSWAASHGGHYAYPATHAEMDRAFERLSAQLRRPADYTLMVTTSEVNREPGELAVRSAQEAASVALAPGVGVAIILDTSGSMREKLGGRRRIAIARASLDRLVAEGLPEGTPVALRVFGGTGSGKAARCQTRLLLPLGPLERKPTRALLRKLNAKKATRTPIAAALAAVPGDLADVSGPRTVVLVTDGNETCQGDPAAAIETLRASGVDARLNIVGFALDDDALREQMTAWAEAGGGAYFDAAGPEALTASITAAVSAPFRVLGPDGDVVAGGTVGGDPVPLDPGTYRVEVLVDPAVDFEDVAIGGGQTVELVLPAPEDDG